LIQAGVQNKGEIEIIFTILSKKQEPKIDFEFPKAPKFGYQTCPTIEEMNSMDFSELSRLPSFRIWNEFGEICFRPVEVN
jgi:hypothetical protein